VKRKLFRLSSPLYLLSIRWRRLPFQRREAAKDIPACVQSRRQCVRVAVASPVKAFCAEIIAASSPWKHNPLPVELVEERQKGRVDPGRNRQTSDIQRCNRSFLLSLLRLDLIRTGLKSLHFCRKLHLGVRPESRNCLLLFRNLSFQS
jgi:hypothetical protein